MARGLAEPMASPWLEGWSTWLPATLAFVGVLGPALLAGGRVGLRSARAVALASLAALVAAMVVAVYQRAGTAALLDLALAGALVALSTLGVRRSFAWGLVAATAIAAARGIALARAGFGTPALLAPSLAGALAWLAAALLALALASVRLKASRRSTRA